MGEFTKADLWFNELFEKAELVWIENKKRATEKLEEKIFGSPSEESTSSSLISAAYSKVMTPSYRILNERSDRVIRPLVDSFVRIRTAAGVSLQTVLSNLQYLLQGGKALPDAVMTEEHINLLMELVRNYIDFSASAPAPSASDAASRSKLYESSRADFEAPAWLTAALVPPVSDRKLHEQIVSHVLMIFTLWSKAGSRRWEQTPASLLVQPHIDESQAAEGDDGLADCTSSMTVLLHKRVSLAILNEYILKVLQQAHRSQNLMTKCFVQLAHSTIVLRAPEKDIPTQVFIHYMQYGPLRDMGRDEYLEILNALSVLIRHLESLDQVLEVIAISLNSWNTVGLSMPSRPIFTVPTEAQHLPPTPLMNPSTQLIVSTQMTSPTSPLLSARKSLPSLHNQYEMYDFFRRITLWRRWDQGWSEAADEETHAAALTIQYWFVNGTPQSQSISLMAAMGILEALVQSNSLTHPHTISVFYGMLTGATMRVARNDSEIGTIWRPWRQTIAVIASQFDQSFPNLDDSLLLQMVTDVLLEDALNLDYIFYSDVSSFSLEERLKKIAHHREAFIFQRIPKFTHAIGAMFNHTKNPVVHEGTIYKLHSYAVHLHHMWRTYQPKFRAVFADPASTTSKSTESSAKDSNKASTTPADTKAKSDSPSQGTTGDGVPHFVHRPEKPVDLGIAVEKAAKGLLEDVFKAYVAIFTSILQSLSYKQITRALEALGFVEFAAPKNAESTEYSLLLMGLVDRFHELRPGDNWIVAYLNLGIASIFGGSSNANRDKSLKLDKPALVRIRQLFTVAQYTCLKYPQFITRSVLEQRGLLSLLFWMLENPHKSINRKAHQTFVSFFMQPDLLSQEPYLGLPAEVLAPPSERQLRLQKAHRSQPHLAQSPTSEAEAPDVRESFIPNSFTEEIFPYYWKITLDCYPAVTKAESITLTATCLLAHTLPIDSPLIPFLLNALMDKISSLRLSKYAANLTVLLVHLIGIVPHSALPLLLSLIEDYVKKSPRKLQIFLCEKIRESTLKNLDYSRKELLVTWCMKLVNSLGLHAKL